MLLCLALHDLSAPRHVLPHLQGCTEQDTQGAQAYAGTGTLVLEADDLVDTLRGSG